MSQTENISKLANEGVDEALVVVAKMLIAFGEFFVKVGNVFILLHQDVKSEVHKFLYGDVHSKNGAVIDTFDENDGFDEEEPSGRGFVH